MAHQAQAVKSWLRRLLAGAGRPAAALVAASFFLAPVLGVGQQLPVPNLVSLPFNLTANGNTNWMPLNGQSTCSVVFTTGATATVTVQGYSDAPNAGVQTPQTVLGIGTAGVITNPTNGQQAGGPPSPQAISGIRLNVAGLSGNVVGSLTCSNAAPPLSIGSLPPVVISTTIPVTVVNTPGVTVQNTPSVLVANTNPPVALPTASAGVAFPATVPQIGAYLLCLPPGGATPSATAGNGIAVNCASNGLIRVSQPFSAPTPANATATATSIPTTGIASAAKGSAGVLVGATFTNSQAATAAYCGVYNASAPTLGTTVPLVYVYVPALTSVPAFVPPTVGITFGTAIAVGCATTYLGSTGSAANMIFASVFYY